MPYSGVPASETERLEECVTKVMATGKDKSSAIAICRESLKLAAHDEPMPPPDIPLVAKLALALQVLSVVDRAVGAANDAPPEMSSDELADSLTDRAGADIAGVAANLFEGTHATNIASVATADLRRKLADPKFRADHPYVMIVTTNPDARVGHKMLDGFVMSSEEAQFSSMLPPFDFGCDCQAIPLTVAQSKAAGLIGAMPVSLDAQLRSKGVTRTPFGDYIAPGGTPISIGVAPGFRPAYGTTDVFVQTDALRAKAHEIMLEEPDAWLELQGWLLWLFGVDILREDLKLDQIQ